MIYQQSLKESAASWFGLPLDTFFACPPTEWETARACYSGHLDLMTRLMDQFDPSGNYNDLSLKELRPYFDRWASARGIGLPLYKKGEKV